MKHATLSVTGQEARHKPGATEEEELVLVQAATLSSACNRTMTDCLYLSPHPVLCKKHDTHERSCGTATELVNITTEK